MKSHEFQAIEQQLKKDAGLFKCDPRETLHDQIMGNIKKSTVQDMSHEYNKQRFFWLVPAGLTAVMLLSFSSLINRPNTKLKEVHNTQVLNTIMIPDKIELNQVSSLIEKQLTNDMVLEQQALMKDLNYLTTFLTIDTEQFD